MQLALKTFFGTRYNLPVGRGTLAIYALLRAWSRGQPTKVAVQGAVCQDVAAAILMAGCTPVFCDVDPVVGQPTRQHWEKARASGATAAIVVHLYGNPGETSLVRQIFPQPECLLIDDAAQSLGAYTPSGLTGTEGDAGIISFGYSKHIQVGGGALLTNDRILFQASAHQLRNMGGAAASKAETAYSEFRRHLEGACEKLRNAGTVDRFSGLLEGYGPVIYGAWRPEWEHSISQALEGWSHTSRLRLQKCDAWRQAIYGTGLVPVGMGAESSPWRYACRLPHCTWQLQYKIGEFLRSRGLYVSHWYLPCHWLLGWPLGSLPGVEILARESFQFWVDEHVTLDEIKRAGAIMKNYFHRF